MVLAAGIVGPDLVAALGWLPVLVAVAATVIAWRRHRRTRRPTSSAPTIGRTVVLAVAMLAEHVPPADMVARLATARAEGWRRETTEVWAAADVLSTTTVASHLTFVQELRRLRPGRWDRLVTELAARWGVPGRARRTDLGRVAAQAAGGPTVTLVVSIGLDHIPAPTLASVLAAARRDGWAREAAEIRAAVEAITSTIAAHLDYGAALRTAETAQGTWRPTWMGGPPDPTTTQPTTTAAATAPNTPGIRGER
jgi:hypothetical protein